MAEIRRALAESPPDNTFEDHYFKKILAEMLVKVSERDEAIRTLHLICGRPFVPEQDSLRMFSERGTLRGDACFEMLVASLTPEP